MATIAIASAVALATIPVSWVTFISAEPRYHSFDADGALPEPEQLVIISLEVSHGQITDLAMSLRDAASMTKQLIGVLEKHDLLTSKESERIQCLIMRRTQHLRDD